MHKYFLSTAVMFSLCVSLTGALCVSAQSTPFTQTSVIRYLTSTGVYSGSAFDPLTKTGVLTVKRTDGKRGVILTDFVITSKTVFLREAGGETTLADFKVDENLSIYASRNPDGSATAVKVTNHNLWLLDPVISQGTITAVNTQTNTVSVTDDTNGQSYAISYTEDTKFLQPKSLPGTEADLVVGKNVRVRGVIRQTGTTKTIERVYVIWVLADEHNDN